jgi:hypothetical protein
LAGPCNSCHNDRSYAVLTRNIISPPAGWNRITFSQKCWHNVPTFL